jgi:hypothetical protein
MPLSSNTPFVPNNGITTAKRSDGSEFSGGGLGGDSQMPGTHVLSDGNCHDSYRSDILHGPHITSVYFTPVS